MSLNPEITVKCGADRLADDDQQRLLSNFREFGVIHTAAEAENPKSSKEHEEFSYPTCDVSVDGSLCLHGGQKIVLPSAVQYGLVGHWSFDQTSAIDSSGMANHATGNVFPGPAQGGFGASAFFRQSYVVVPHSKAFETPDFSYTAWVYMMQDAQSEASSTKGLRWCPIIHKGIMRAEPADYQSAPGILVEKEKRQIKVVISTDVNTGKEGEYLISNAKLRYHYWTHIAVVRHVKRLRLYVNGILDSTISTEGWTRTNELPLYIGTSPSVQNLCDVPLMVDELRVYNRAIGRDEIQAEASPALGGVEPSFVRFSCKDCTLEDAVAGCPSAYHICSSLELHTGGYQVARAMGYMDSKTHIWTHSTVENADTGSPTNKQTPETGLEKEQKGLGLCCANPV